jgi:hypothetical protein
MDRYMSQQLDKHITGNYGMDQFKGEEAYESLCEFACANCFMQVLGQCEGELSDNGPCLVIQDVMQKEDAAQAAADDAMYEQYQEDRLYEEEQRQHKDSAEIDHDDPINQR